MYHTVLYIQIVQEHCFRRGALLNCSPFSQFTLQIYITIFSCLTKLEIYNLFKWCQCSKILRAVPVSDFTSRVDELMFYIMSVFETVTTTIQFLFQHDHPGLEWKPFTVWYGYCTSVHIHDSQCKEVMKSTTTMINPYGRQTVFETHFERHCKFAMVNTFTALGNASGQDCIKLLTIVCISWQIEHKILNLCIIGALKKTTV